MEMKEECIICKALSDTNRLEIVRMLSDGEKCGCKILDKFNITQPTLSHHMKILVNCGIVNDRKEGKWHYYCLLYTSPSPRDGLLSRMPSSA